MHRFLVPPELAALDTFALPEGEAHHAANVLRVSPGDPVLVLDGHGQELHCHVTAATRRAVSLTVCQRFSHPRPAWSITLCAAILKGKAFDLLLQKATELGATRLIPIRCERTVAQPAAGDTADKLEKWRATCIEAAKQCGTPWLPKIETPRTPAALLHRAEPCDLALVASLATDTAHPREILRAFTKHHGQLPQNLAVWIGPEGDFTPAELALLKNSGAHPITLGPHTLRAETAVLYTLAILAYELTAPRHAGGI